MFLFLLPPLWLSLLVVNAILPPFVQKCELQWNGMIKKLYD